MDSRYLFETLDTHTAGEPTRIITDGFRWGGNHGSTDAYRRRFEEEFDWVRQMLMKEPRGHADMFGAVPVELDGGQADLGLFFMDNKGYLDMCGHATIGAITALIETGRLEPKEKFHVDTPAGTVEARPSMKDDAVQDVGIKNVSSYVHGRTSVEVPEVGQVEANLVYAGNLFALVNAEQMGIEVTTENTRRFIDLGLAIRRAINAEHEITNRVSGRPMEVELTEFYQRRAEADRNITVFGDGQVDRSPCGTGTCAKMTLMYEDGELKRGEPYVHESVIGTRFEGEIEDMEDQEGRSVITPVIRGSAFLTGKHTFYLDPDDPIGWFDIEEPKVGDR